jgi:hypothetical protein
MILKRGVPDHHWIKPGVSLGQSHGFHQLRSGQHGPPQQPCPAGAHTQGQGGQLQISQGDAQVHQAIGVLFGGGGNNEGLGGAQDAVVSAGPAVHHWSEVIGRRRIGLGFDDPFHPVDGSPGQRFQFAPSFNDRPMKVLGVAGRWRIAGRLDQLLQGFPVNGRVLEQPDGSPGAEELFGLIPRQDQVFFYFRTVFDVHPGNAQGTERADGHAVPTCHAIGLISLGNLREMPVIFLGDNSSGALGRADAVLLAPGFIDRQEGHAYLRASCPIPEFAELKRVRISIDSALLQLLTKLPPASPAESLAPRRSPGA